jgi:hypothetical protein
MIPPASRMSAVSYIHHMSLVIEQGASFDGRCRRPADAAELRPDLTSRAPIHAA